MVILRILGALLLLVALLALVYDGTQSLAGGAGLVMTPLGKHWYQISPQSLSTAQAAVQRYVHPLLWDPGIQTLLAVPTFAALGVLGLGFMHLGRRRRRINIYTN